MHALYLLERDDQPRTGKTESLSTDETIKMAERRTVLIQEYLSRLNHIKRLDAREETLTSVLKAFNQDNTLVPINRPNPLTLALPPQETINRKRTYVCCG